MENPVRSTLTDDGTAIVSVTGEIDFANSGDVARGICHALREWSPAVLRVDLREASFIDSTGLGALIEGYRSATERETEFVVTNPSDGFRRVLAVTGLTDLFGLVNAEELPEENAAKPGTSSDVAI